MFQNAIMYTGPQVGLLCSFLGKRVLDGDVDAIKALYRTTWKEHPALIKTITQLQECITSVEIDKDSEEKYCTEFLYYWGMLCIGDLSTLISRDLGTANHCFDKIVHRVPKAKARLAFIQLLKSDEPAKSDRNVESIDILRQWAGRGDLFSRIVLAKISFYQFLNERQMDDANLPMRVLRLLEPPCQKGHPVAIRFWNEIIDYSGATMDTASRMSETYIQEHILFDL